MRGAVQTCRRPARLNLLQCRGVENLACAREGRGTRLQNARQPLHWHRRAEQIALHLRAAKLHAMLALLFGFDAFGGRGADLVGRRRFCTIACTICENISRSAMSRTNERSILILSKGKRRKN